MRRWASLPADSRRWSSRSRCLERRIATGAVSPDDAVGSINKLRPTIAEARAVGDLDGLQDRLEALSPLIADQRAARRAERARQQEETRAAKEKFVLEAERLAAGNDWRGGVNRFRALLEEWKALPRLDRATDDAAVAPILQRTHDLYATPQGTVRPAERAARGRAVDQREACHRGRGRWRIPPTGARQPVPSVI